MQARKLASTKVVGKKPTRFIEFNPVAVASGSRLRNGRNIIIDPWSETNEIRVHRKISVHLLFWIAVGKKTTFVSVMFYIVGINTNIVFFEDPKGQTSFIVV